MRDDPYVVALVARATEGDEGAWDEIVERYAPLVWSICARYRLSATDIEDVGQTIWTGLVKELGKLREPAALPGWLATTTRRECLRVVRESQRYEPFSAEPEDSLLAAEAAPDQVEEEVLRAERHACLRAALAELPEECRRLIILLASDPPLSYPEIGDRLGLPVGSIGPKRGRCLERLRRSPHLASLADTLREDPPPARGNTSTRPPQNPVPLRNPVSPRNPMPPQNPVPPENPGPPGNTVPANTRAAPRHTVPPQHAGSPQHAVPAQHTVPSGETGQSGAHGTSRRRVS